MFVTREREYREKERWLLRNVKMRETLSTESHTK